ncbi:MAG TPA: dihydrofolate reductase family protein [Candidatus Sulfotelmatobacter sp.]|nr:dihydrofolate reductase family protein [Candidatus Sulfotelmatobacter sp.]
MTRLLYDVSVSLDGFSAGVDRDDRQPMGSGGERLGVWRSDLAAFRRRYAFAGLEGGVTNASTAVFEEDTTGALIVGRTMFGGGSGPWGDPAWEGPWGGNPFGVPVFVLTHHRREPLVLDGAPPFTFVTDGPEAALAMARQAAKGRDVLVGGSASVARQYLAAGLLDQIDLHLVPVFLGQGLRVFDDAILAGVTLEQVRVVEAPGVTHLRYRVLR